MKLGKWDHGWKTLQILILAALQRSGEGSRNSSSITKGKQSGLFLLLAAWLIGLSGSAQPLPRPVAPLHLGFLQNAFFDLNPRDLEASFSALTRLIARKHGYDLKAETHIYQKSADLETAIRKGELHVAVLGAWEYSAMDVRGLMEPAFVHVEQGRAVREYLLLTRRGGGLNTLRDLKGKDLLLLERSSGLLPETWLDVLLAEEHLGTKETFFHSLEVTQKPVTAVLPVFFGNRQACVVDSSSYQVMTELNPQLRSTLQVVAASPSYISSVICLSQNGWDSEQSRELFLRSLRDLHLEPEGRQILTMFKVERLEPFQEGYLLPLNDLRSRRNHLMPKAKP